MADGLATVDSRRAVWGVAALVREVGELVAGRFGACSVRGELSGFSRAPSGHCYFNLKDVDDGGAMLRCAMFRRAATLLAFAPADGQLVEVRGRLGVYEPRGELQLVVEAMQGAGAGALYEQLLRLRARLEAQGLFDPLRKRSLPAHPRTIGVVTSLGAAALHDVLIALQRRAPQIRVVVYPSPVQGAEAGGALAQAVAAASQRAEVDVLIVCRGGGALEDLWAFNDERVVRAIVAASMPVVCGVGHETDITLADLAADLRAPTPTAAAEMAAPTRQSCMDVLDAYAVAMLRRVHERLDSHAQCLDRAALRLARPTHRLNEQAQLLALLAHRLTSHAPRITQAQQARLGELQRDLDRRGALCLAHCQRELATYAARVHALDPGHVLSRGYAWLADQDDRPITTVRRLSVGASLKAVLHDGEAQVRVETVPGRTNG